MIYVVLCGISMFICIVVAIIGNDPVVSRLDLIIAMLWMFAGLQGVKDLKEKEETRKQEEKRKSPKMHGLRDERNKEDSEWPIT